MSPAVMYEQAGHSTNPTRDPAGASGRELIPVRKSNASRRVFPSESTGCVQKKSQHGKGSLTGSFHRQGGEAIYLETLTPYSCRDTHETEVVRKRTLGTSTLRGEKLATRRNHHVKVRREVQEYQKKKSSCHLRLFSGTTRGGGRGASRSGHLHRGKRCFRRHERVNH